MTPRVRAAFEVYRDLGPTRRLIDAAKLINRSHSLLQEYSAKYEWTRLVTEHDHAELREALGKREIVRERGTQRLVEMIDDAVTVLHGVMMDQRQIPILDRQGVHMEGPDGELLYRPLVKASTRAQAAEKILGIAGLVPVKRTETVDRTAESLDAAAAVLRSMSPRQIDQLLAILDGDDGEP